MEEFYRDFDWELDRFVEYRLPIKKQLYFLGLEHTIFYFLKLPANNYKCRRKIH